MIHFLVTRSHEYTLKSLMGGQLGDGGPRCKAWNYDRFLRRKRIPAGTYIFSDLERMTPAELRLAAEAYRIIAAAPRCRAVNDPARAMGRYELLRNLAQRGINDFDAYRA